MPTYRIPASLSYSGFITIEANDREQAEEKANLATTEQIEDRSYIDDSIQIHFEDVEVIGGLKVMVNGDGGDYWLEDESGDQIVSDFWSVQDAEEFAEEQGWTVVDSFNI